jgi:hypothetical protein
MGDYFKTDLLVDTSENNLILCSSLILPKRILSEYKLFTKDNVFELVESKNKVSFLEASRLIHSDLGRDIIRDSRMDKWEKVVEIPFGLSIDIGKYWVRNYTTYKRLSLITERLEKYASNINESILVRLGGSESICFGTIENIEEAIDEKEPVVIENISFDLIRNVLKKAIDERYKFSSSISDIDIMSELEIIVGLYSNSKNNFMLSSNSNRFIELSD